MTTKIEWCKNQDGTKGEVWNPVTGCTKISEGCQNCYAERIAKRFWGDRPFNQVICHKDRLGQPSYWRDPKRVFVCSMSDLFHPEVPGDFIEDVIEVIANYPQHIFMVLTKRPERMKTIFTEVMIALKEKPLSNLWLGVTAENQARADERIPILLQIPAVVRFVSVEPMLESLDLTHDLDGYQGNDKYGPRLDWVIAGAESGPGARFFDESWARSLRDQCIEVNVPFFYKQGRIDGKLVKMPELDGRVWDQYPEA